MRYAIGLVCAAALAGAAEAQAPADASFMSGYWLSCADGRTVSETWSDPRAGVMLGTGFTLARGKASWEIMRIAPSPAGLTFYAQPSGQPPADFLLAAEKSGPEKLVFENLAHDFPQRVIYERKGEALAARIEGQINGEPRAMTWVYSPAKLNAGCGAKPG